MGFNSVIAVFLGLLIQLTQVQLFSGDGAAPPCIKMGNSMGCCESVKSCHCLEDSDPDQQSTPLTVAAVDSKLLLSRAPETDPVSVFISPTDSSILVASPTSRVCGGFFAGVPVSVAFCSFVI